MPTGDYNGWHSGLKNGLSVLALRSVTITLALSCFVFASLLELTVRDGLSLTSPAAAKPDKAGKKNGGGNGGGNGNGPGKGNGNGNGNGNQEQDEEGAGQSIGDDFRGEGFAPRGKDIDLKSLSERRHSDDRDLAVDTLPPGHAKKAQDADWGAYLGLGKGFDLNFIKTESDRDAAVFVEGGAKEKADKHSGDHPGKGHAYGHDKEKKGKKDKGLEEVGLVEDAGLTAAQREFIPTAADTDAARLSLSIAPDSYQPDEVLVRGLSAPDLERARSLGFEPARASLPADGAIETLKVPNGMDALEALALLRKTLPEDQFHLNRLYRPYHPAMKAGDAGKEPTDPAGRAGDCSNDRCFGRVAIQWKNSLASCARGARIGVIDTEVDLQHPTFVGQDITQRDFLPQGRLSAPTWHGTGVLALLAGKPDSPTPGLVHDASFFAANIFFSGEGGAAMTDTVSLLRALEWMAASRARVINMSFTGPQDDLVQERVKAMSGKGFVFAAAAGNEGPAASPVYPAAYPEVIAVTAVGKDLRIYPSANRGGFIDLAAPGVRVWTAAPGARGAYRSGTSFAAPFATAVLALQKEDALGGPKAALLDGLKTVSLGPQGRGPIYGRGLLQAPSECPAPVESVSYWGTQSASAPR
jgi:hypothetical protein